MLRMRLSMAGPVFALAALVAAGCSSSDHTLVTAEPSTSAGSASTIVEPTSTSTSSTTSTVGTTTTTAPVTSTPSASEPGGIVEHVSTQVQVVPAFVAFISDSAGELLLRPTLGDADARVIYRTAPGTTLDGVAVWPDGREAVVGVRGAACASTLLSVDLSDGTAHEFLADASAPVLSSDGAWLAFVRVAPSQCDVEQLVLRNVASGDERPLGAAQSHERGGWAWSTDSSRLAYLDCAPQCSLLNVDVNAGATVNYGATASLRRVDSAGNPQTVTVAIGAPVTWVPFAPGGSPAASARCACDDDGAQVFGTTDAGDRPQLSVGAKVDNRTVAFALDNELVVSAAPGASQTVYRRHGRGPVVDLGVQSNGFAAWPTARPWSAPLPAPSGGQPATLFTTVRGALVELESNTGAVVRVLYAPRDGFVNSIEYDRSSGRLFAGVQVGDCGTRLVSVSANDGTATVIGEGVDPALSPDGMQLAYVASLWRRTSTEPVSPQGIGCALSVVVVRDLRSGAERQVLPSGYIPGDSSTGSWESGAWQITWAPDSRRLAYSLGYEGAATFTVDVDSLNVRRVIAMPAIDTELKDHLGGYPEFMPVAFGTDGLHLEAFCYGCGVPSVHVRASDGVTVDEILETPLPAADVRNGYGLRGLYGADGHYGLGRVNPGGASVLLRTDTVTGLWR